MIAIGGTALGELRRADNASQGLSRRASRVDDGTLG